MANYSLVVNSTFQPFSYQELSAPVQKMSDYHEKLAEEYDKLSTQADVLEAMGSNDSDKKSGAYNRYKAYSDSLRQEADDLYRFGLNTESRQRLTDLRRKYNTDIVPIQHAWAKREKEADMQMDAYLKNPTLMFTRNAANTSIDDYVRNPSGGYGVINGANITAQMSNMAKNLAKQVRSGYKQNIDDYTYNYIQKYGLDENLIRNWQDSPTLSAMFRQVMESNGVTPEALSGSANMQNIINQSTGYAEMGMWNAMGEDKSNIIENYGARLAAQANKEIEVARAKAGAGDTDNPYLPGSTVQINFADAEGAGNALRRELAVATVKALQESRLPKAQEILDEWKDKGGVEAAIEHWTKNGLDLKKIKDTGMGMVIGNYIRDNVTSNENIINMWRYGQEKNEYLNDFNRRNTRTFIVSPNTLVPITRPSSGEGSYNRDWSAFNKEAHSGYYVNAIQLNDKPTALKTYLSRIMDNNMIGDTYKLYDIVGINTDGSYKYSAERTPSSELPHTGTKDEIDWGSVHRMMLSNGDYLLTWKDDSGESKKKVLKRSDISNEAVKDWEKADKRYKSLLKLYTDGFITGEEFAAEASEIGVANMANSYRDMQEVDVKDYSLE